MVLVLVKTVARMPDIEQLMQVWPGEFEEFLQNNPMPDLADLELDLPSYVKIFASVLDVPARGPGFGVYEMARAQAMMLRI